MERAIGTHFQMRIGRGIGVRALVLLRQRIPEGRQHGFRIGKLGQACPLQQVLFLLFPSLRRYQIGVHRAILIRLREIEVAGFDGSGNVLK